MSRLVILGEPSLYQIHNVSKDNEQHCCLCDIGLEVETKVTVPVLVEGESDYLSYMMLCAKDHKRLVRRMKFKWFYSVLVFFKKLVKRGKILCEHIITKKI